MTKKKKEIEPVKLKPKNSIILENPQDRKTYHITSFYYVIGGRYEPHKSHLIGQCNGCIAYFREMGRLMHNGETKCKHCGLPAFYNKQDEDFSIVYCSFCPRHYAEEKV